MKIKEGFELMTVCDQNIIISHGKKNINFSKVITLNESASLVWNAVVGKEFTVEDAAKALLDEYEVEETVAMNDAKILVEDWINAGMVDE